MPHRVPRASIRVSWLGLTTLSLVCPVTAYALPPPAFQATTTPHAAINPGADKADKNVVLSADNVTKDDINNTVAASGHVELVQGATMLLAEHIVWNQTTDIVVATGDVKLVDDQGNIFFGDYLEITDDMRQAFMKNVSGLLADNSRLVGRQS